MCTKLGESFNQTPSCSQSLFLALCRRFLNRSLQQFHKNRYTFSPAYSKKKIQYKIKLPYKTNNTRIKIIRFGNKKNSFFLFQNFCRSNRISPSLHFQLLEVLKNFFIVGWCCFSRSAYAYLVFYASYFVEIPKIFIYLIYYDSHFFLFLKLTLKHVISFPIKKTKFFLF